MEKIKIVQKHILDMEEKLKGLDCIEDAFTIARIYDNIASLYYVISMTNIEGSMNK